MSNDEIEVAVVEPAPEPDAQPEPERAAPITSRFLFVDVAAQRAKQLRRGARARLDEAAEKPFKLERIAMREVQEGLVLYTVPPLKSSPGEATKNG
jgi:DNA-directed RNA polymerase omega subunit